METGTIIRRRKTNFTQVSNYIFQDKTISPKALGIYAKLNYYLDIPNYVLHKSYFMKQFPGGKKSFQSGWDELIEKGYLIQTKVRGAKGYWDYTYELLDYPCTQKGDTDKGETDEGCTEKVTTNNTILNNTKENNTYSSSSSSINTPREESTEKPIPLDDEEEKEISQIVKTVFGVQEGKRLTSLPSKYGCDGNMIFPALKLALENRADKLVPYIRKVFEDWQNSGIKHLQDIGIDSLDSDEKINDYIKIYREQLDAENKDPSKYVKDYEMYEQIFGDRPYFSDKSGELKALSKIYPSGKVLEVCRSMVIEGKPINNAIDLLMRRDRFENNNYWRYL